MTGFMTEIEIVDRVVLTVFVDVMDGDIVLIDLNVGRQNDFSAPIAQRLVRLDELLEMEGLIHDPLHTFGLDRIPIKAKLVLEPSNELLQPSVAVGEIHVYPPPRRFTQNHLRGAPPNWRGKMA
jgi:hypothetical protein